MDEKDILSELTEIRRAFDEFFVSKNPMMMVSDPTWRPPMDIFETPGYILVRMEVAGMQKEDIDVSLQGKKLIIRGDRRNRRDHDLPSRSYRQMEIKYAHFEREILLQDEFDDNGINARYHDGFLEVKVPTFKKKPKSQKVKIDIQEED